MKKTAEPTGKGQTELFLEYACVDEFIGPEARKRGVRCPCSKHSPNGPEPNHIEGQPEYRDPKAATLDRLPRKIPHDLIRDGEEKKQD